jgi:hypothetical protein
VLLNLELLTVPAEIKRHEMAEVFRGDLPTELQLEGCGSRAISSGLLANLHHHVARFGTGVDELAPH